MQNHDAARPELLDLSTSEAWLEASGRFSAALDAIVYAHPAFCSLAVREDLASGERFAVLERPRRARAPDIAVPLASSDPEKLGAAFAEAIPAEPDQARSLGAALALAQPWEQARPLAWAQALAASMDSLGWGASSRWDPRHEDGIDRDSEEGIEAFESACAQSLPEFVAAVSFAAESGCEWLEGDPQSSCRAMASMAEAVAIERQPELESKPAARAFKGPRL